MSENSMSLKVVSKANIAVNRFGYGARGNELAQAELDPQKWITSQLLSVPLNESLPHSDEVMIGHAKYLKQKRKNKKLQKKNQNKLKKATSEPANKMLQYKARNTLINLSNDSLMQTISSSHSVSWRLLDFFSNHFSVSTSGRLMVGLAATLEREAIAPNLLGNFSDMLLAVEQHPAMLIYLNNEKSFGPNSRLAKKRKVGLNENLAREILELHTLGVDGGYHQEDVIELAKGITGWSVKSPKRDNGTGFIFRAYGHEPGARKLLGKKYSDDGIAQGKEMLGDLAMQPATINHVCTKIAQYFVCQNPPKSLINKMEVTWLKTQGNIKQVMLSLFNSDEAWLPSAQKFKTPREFLISTYRAIAPHKINSRELFNALTSLGQKLSLIHI